MSFPTPSQASTPVGLPQDNINSSSRPPLLSLFFAFQIIGGHIGFPLLLVAVFALGNASSRHPLFINFCVTWIVSSVVFCILLYAGYDTGPEPPFMICSLQASLVYAMPVMSAVSLTALVFHLWICLRGSMNQTIMTRSREIQWALVGLPYLLALPFIIAPASLAGLNPSLVTRRRTGFGYFCSVDSHPLRTGVAASVVVFLVLLLVAEFLVARIFYRNWKSVRTVKIYGWSSANLVARIALFTLYVFTGIVACIIAIAFPSGSFRILFQASLPTVSFLLFATRPNLWRRDRSTSPSAPSEPSTNASNSRALPQETIASFSSAPYPKSMPIATTRSNSTDTDSLSLLKRGNTFASSYSAYSTTEEGAAEKVLPALPVHAPRQTLPEDVGMDDVMLSALEAPQNPGPWEDVRGPDAIERGVQQREARAYDSSSINSVEGRPRRI